jgi:hypothetical protein
MQFLIYAEVTVGWTLLLVVPTLFARAYWRTRDVGFIWLAIATFVWPFMTVPAHDVLAYVAHRLPFQSVGQYATALRTSQQIIPLVLLAIALLYLGRARTRMA